MKARPLKVRDEHTLKLSASRKIRVGDPIKVAKRSGKALPSNMTPDHSRFVGYAMNDARPGEIVTIAVHGTIIW